MFKSLLLKGRTFCLLLCCIISSLAVTAQTRQTGKVIGGDDKLPVVGASVKIDGTNTGTLTDVNGNFTLSVSAGNVLVVSYIGYQTQRYTVGSGAAFTITLQPANSTLNEVVVTGYQTQVKKDITGAVGIVDIADAKKIPATSSEQLLQGQVSGVNVINNGAPGAASAVFIRGIANFGNASPLYVIDGVQSSNMSQVNPSDIESISVLKDAGSAAIYGVAGGNGVIVVTTKHGKQGKAVISYDGYYGVQKPLSGNVWHLATPTQVMEMAQEAGDPAGPSLYDPNKTGTFTLPVYGYHGPSAVGTFGSSGVTDDPSIAQYYHFDAANPGNDFQVQKFNQQGTDWFHAVFHTAPQQSHTITGSGGTDHSTFLYSLQYLDQQGTLIETFEKRYQARVNNTYSFFNNHLRFGENGYVFYRENNGGNPYNQQQEGGSISETYRTLAIIPVYDIAGNYGGGFAGPSGEPLGNSANPVAIQQRSANDLGRTWNIQGSVFAEADFLKYFTVRTAFSGNSQNNFFYFTGYNTYENYESHTSPNSYSEASNYSFNYNYTNTIAYKETFGKHVISAFAGYELRETGGQQVGTYATNFVSLDPAYLSTAQTTVPTSISLTNSSVPTELFQPTSTQSFFGRVDYSYADKYLFGATVRRDGYSEFFPGRQYGTFPSVSLGWRISQEDFLKGVSWLNDLKLRGSYGSAGNNANIGGANTYNTYGSSFGGTDYPITGSLNTLTTGYAQTSIGNPRTTWETDKTLNIGLDISVINHLELSAEYYRKDNSGLLFQATLPSTAGAATAPFINIGDVKNKGFDFSATYHDAIGRDFRFSLTANITAYKNDISSITQTQYLFGGSRLGAFVEEAQGLPIGEFYGYKILGIFQNPAQLAATPHLSGAAVGSYIYADTNHDGIVDASDQTAIGNPNPNFVYGLNINASYKGFDFSMVLYGSQGNKDYNYVKWWTDTYNSFPGGKQTNLLTNSAIVDPTTMTVTNPGATQEALSTPSTPSSSFYIENGSFLKCRVAQIGYTFNPIWAKSIGMSRLHVYVQGTNLFTITKYTGPDPELLPSAENTGQGSTASSSFGVDWGAYPNNQKTFLLGVNASF